jgi:DNA-binding FrmR family transcriptional regulator
MLTKAKEDALKRMGRIVGQAHGVHRVIERERYCPQILQQIAAVRAALASVGTIILRGHLETCVSEAIRGGEEGAVITELDRVLGKFFR